MTPLAENTRVNAVCPKTLPVLLAAMLAIVVAGCDTAPVANPAPLAQNARPTQDPAPPPAVAPDPKPAPSAPTPKPPPVEPSGAPPLVLDDEPLLLLDAPARIKHKGPMVDNNRCFVCHENYTDEELTVQHAVAEVGCEKCHGSSDDHCADEGNITPPTIFYTKADVDPSCTVCHDPDKVKDAALWCLYVRKPEEADKNCTECHGAHRLILRAVRWNPKTRQPYTVVAQGE